MNNNCIVLNNKKIDISKSNPNASVLDWVRLDRELKGTKEGCAEGDFGACSVLISPVKGCKFKPANSCLLKLGQVSGSEIVTVEGLGNQKYPSSVQKILAKAQEDGLIPVIFDTENAIDPEGAERLGLDISKVKYVPCTSIEQARNSLYKFLMVVKEKGLEGKFIVAIDSLANLQSELELSRMSKDSTSSDMGTKARAMKTLMQTCTNLGSVTQTTILCTNHVIDEACSRTPAMTA